MFFADLPVFCKVVGFLSDCFSVEVDALWVGVDFHGCVFLRFCSGSILVGDSYIVNMVNIWLTMFRPIRPVMNYRTCVR